MLGNLFLSRFVVRDRPLCAYCQSSVFLSDCVPNLAMSLLRTLSSGTPGSLLSVVVWDVLTTVLRGANFSQSPLRSRLERFETFRASLSSRDRSVLCIGLVSLGYRMNLETGLFFSPLKLLPASTWVFVIVFSMRISLRSPVTQPLSSK